MDFFKFGAPRPIVRFLEELPMKVIDHCQELLDPYWDRVVFMPSYDRMFAGVQFNPYEFDKAFSRDTAITNIKDDIRRIQIPFPQNLKDYYTILHEFGHINDPALRPRKRLEHEAVAWKWALQNAVVPANNEIFEFVSFALDSHKRGVEQDNEYGSHRIEFPEREHMFWTMLNGLDTASLHVVLS